MRAMFLRGLILMSVLAVNSFAQMPPFYKTVDRVTWVVKSLDESRQGWTKLGLSDIQDYGHVSLQGEYRGKAVTVEVKEISGHLDNLTIDMIQPLSSDNAFSDFLLRHGQGIFAIVHPVASAAEVQAEIARLRGVGVGVLQQVTSSVPAAQRTTTFFDTELQGKYVLGLAYWTGGAPPSGSSSNVSHIAPVIREWQSVSAFWQKLGFPKFDIEHATPRPDSRYRGRPLWLAFEVGYQRYTQFSYEWIIPPAEPRTIYVDFLKLHGEGIQHLGLAVADLPKAIAEYQRLGYPIWQSGAWGDTGKSNSGQYAYMDTDKIGGVSVELIHANK